MSTPVSALTLEDIIPQLATFKLRALDTEMELRPINVDDELWLRREWPGDQLHRVLGRIEPEAVCRIVFHQLTPESKALLVVQKITIMNEQGESVQGTIGGVALLKTLISGNDELLLVYHALMTTVGISREVIAKITDEKKNITLANLNPPPIGPTSSTSLPPSTDGQLSIFEQEPSARLAGVGPRSNAENGGT